MKTNEQIKKAEETLKLLRDYVELARVEKKLKVEANKENVSNMIENIVIDANKNVSEL